MSKRHFDKDGTYTGRTTDEGRHFDKDGTYTGRTTDEGRHFDEDGNLEGNSEDDSGGCFVTTACVEFLGLTDNCHELQTLRRLRDQYMLSTQKGRLAVSTYYQVAPQIVAAIRNCPDESTELELIYQACVLPAVRLVECGDYQGAHDFYEHQIREIALRYGILDLSAS